jgi:hypothetical protein
VLRSLLVAIPAFVGARRIPMADRRLFVLCLLAVAVAPSAALAQKSLAAPSWANRRHLKGSP